MAKLSDGQAKKLLLKWPERTKKLWQPPGGSGYWLRCRPTTGKGHAAPCLTAPGASLFKTQPDAMWVFFDPDFCDVVAIEVCGTIQNLNDKRSRYQPSSHSLMLEVQQKWASEIIQVQSGAQKSRQTASGTMPSIQGKTALPVRFLRVLYALPDPLYKSWKAEQTPTGYEFFCAHSSLSSYTSPPMQTFLKRMAISAHFYT